MKPTIGLTTLEADNLLQQFGPNQLPSTPPRSILQLLFAQLKNFLTLLLVAAASFSLISGDYIDSILIFIIVILNSCLGFFQEYKASRELQALKNLTVPTCRVIRDGQQIEIPTKQLVPGDLVVVEAGTNIPADGNLIEAHDFSVNESSLTGESLPVFKSTQATESQVYFGTSITTGRAKFIVTQTGLQTKFGKLAATLSSIDDEVTPLEFSLRHLAKVVTIVSLGLSAVLFLINTLLDLSLFDRMLASIALLVASVPEGLPAVVTIVLTFGVRRMYKHRTLVRRLSSIESLGSASVICTDKTGTLTENKMSVNTFFPQTAKKTLQQLSTLCNSSSLVTESGDRHHVLGDTTEGALLEWAAQDLNLTELRQTHQLLHEQPFDSRTRQMGVLIKSDSAVELIIKGAPEVILPQTSLSESEIHNVEQQFQTFASQGLRVLAFATVKLPPSTRQIPHKPRLKFVGLVAISDTIRSGIKQAVEQANKAGIRTIMITGDNELTARFIAREVGILRPDREIFTGQMLDALTDSELDQRIAQIDVFARTSPEQKLRIVQSLQRSGQIVAVTGDGVNDSLALKQAAVGVAMGTTGTDVAKEASDIVILDDDYTTLIKAIEQGRVIYQNILKTTRFLLAGNLAEVLLIMLSSVFLLPTPLLPVQLLWVNFVTDGLPALALAADSPSNKIMLSPPRSANQNILSPSILRTIALTGVIIASICICLYLVSWHYFGLNIARSVAFTSIVVTQMVYIFSMRRHHGLFSNRYLVAAVLFVLFAQLLIVTFEPFRVIFKLV